MIWLAKALDKTVDVFFPGWGARRHAARQRKRLQEFRVQMAETLAARFFDGARPERTGGQPWLAAEKSPDAGAAEDLESLQWRCWDLTRNNSIAASAVRVRVANTVGTGIAGSSRVRQEDFGRVKLDKETAEAVRRRIEDVVRRWSAGGVDRSRRQTLPQFERLVENSIATYGEAFIAIGFAETNGPLHTVLDCLSPLRFETPPERETDPRCRMGVQHDERGKVVGWWRRNSHPGDDIEFDPSYTFEPRFDNTEWDAENDRVRRKDPTEDAGRVRMIHVFEQLHPEQSRGWPWMAAVMDDLENIEDTFDYELAAKQVEACFGLIFTGGKGSASAYERANSTASGDTETDRADNPVRLEDIYPGMIHYAQEDEEVRVVDPARPGANFAPFMEMQLRRAASGLGVPYELLAQCFSDVTFASGTLSMQGGQLNFSMFANLQIDQLLVPLWEILTEEAFFMGHLADLGFGMFEYLKAPEIFSRCSWRAPTWPYTIDQSKVAQARKTALESEQVTKADVYIANGADAEDKEAELQAERMRDVEHQVQLAVHRRKLEGDAGLEPGESDRSTPSPDPASPAEQDPEPVGAAA